MSPARSRRTAAPSARPETTLSADGAEILDAARQGVGVEVGQVDGAFLRMGEIRDPVPARAPGRVRGAGEMEVVRRGLALQAVAAPPVGEAVVAGPALDLDVRPIRR